MNLQQPGRIEKILSRIIFNFIIIIFVQTYDYIVILYNIISVYNHNIQSLKLKSFYLTKFKQKLHNPFNLYFFQFLYLDNETIIIQVII